VSNITTTSRAESSVLSSNARAALCAYGPPEPIATVMGVQGETLVPFAVEPGQ